MDKSANPIADSAASAPLERRGEPQGVGALYAWLHNPM